MVFIFIGSKTFLNSIKRSIIDEDGDQKDKEKKESTLHGVAPKEELLTALRTLLNSPNSILIYRQGWEIQKVTDPYNDVLQLGLKYGELILTHHGLVDYVGWRKVTDERLLAAFEAIYLNTGK